MDIIIKNILFSIFKHVYVYVKQFKNVYVYVYVHVYVYVICVYPARRLTVRICRYRSRRPAGSRYIDTKNL